VSLVARGRARVEGDEQDERGVLARLERAREAEPVDAGEDRPRR
jgi:hypothetical protein